MITVSKTGKCDYTSIQEAVNNAKSGDTILIEEGIYNERVEIKTPGLTLTGCNTDFREYIKAEDFEYSFEDTDGNLHPNRYIPSDKTVITYGLYGNMPAEDIGKLGTFRSYTMFIDAENVSLKNLTIENSAGAGPDIGQAIALYAEGEGISCSNIRLLGWQDTLFTGPLPPKEIEKNGFIGPKQFAQRINGRQYYTSSYIEGDIDFIFGSATAYYDNCYIFQKNRTPLLIYKYLLKNDIKMSGSFSEVKLMEAARTGLSNEKYEELKKLIESDESREAKSYATAASTPEGQDYGYIFDNCRFESDCPEHSCYLGRPWRNFAKVLIRNSYLGNHIHPAGFHNWNKKDAESTVSFCEYKNYGPGASDHRAPFVKELNFNEIQKYRKQKVFS
ncbi:MAG: pectin methylesterase [Oribacterium sp.]|nr:pectin methylesterase [Oribacterium sp.]